MKAWVVTDTGPRLLECPEPAMGETDVRVRVRAAALNRVDLAMSKGHRHGRAGGAGGVLGVEFAGEVVSVGPQVRAFAPGDRVMGSGAGAFAEIVTTDWGRLLPVPSGMDDTRAACLPVALQTMHDALATRGQLERGQSVLIHGASSGVGLMGLRIARALGAQQVIGSSRTTEKRERLASFGADLGVDPSEAGWVDQVLAATGSRGVDLVVDQVSGPAVADLFRLTRLGGCVVNVGRLGGSLAPFDFDLHALRRLSYIGVTFRTRSREDVREISQRVMEDLGPALERGELSLPIHASFELDAADRALACMAEDQHFGKLVLCV